MLPLPHLVGLVAVGLRDPAAAGAAVVLLHVHLGAGRVEVPGPVQPLDHHLLGKKMVVMRVVGDPLL